MEQKFIMEGLNCAHCAGKIEEAIKNTEGFSKVSLVFPTKTLYLNHKDKNVIKLVQKITDDIEDGVTVKAIEDKNSSEENKSFIKENLLLFIAILFGAVAIVLESINMNEIAVACVSAVAVILSGYKVFISGAKALFKLRLDENTLMAIAVVAAFILGQYTEGAMVTILFGIGEMLEDKAVSNSRKSIEKLANIQPDTATILHNGHEETVKAEAVEIGTTIIVKPHERVPLDGVIIEGETSVDTSAVTGESLPKDCKVDDELLSGMINGENLIKIKTTKSYHNSTASRIIKLVEEASVTKSKNEKLISKFAAIYTPIVVIISILIAFLPPVLGFGTFSEWIYKGLVCLVASCPCAIVISVPLSYYSGIGAASKKGVLLKGGKYLEALAKADTMVFDKTGTLTQGKLEIVNITPYNDYTEQQVLALAAACEKNSSHPIAKAIKDYYHGEIIPLENYREKSGYGVMAEYQGKELLCGSKKLLNSDIDTDATVFLIYDNQLIGTIQISDAVRKDAANVLSKLKKQGVKKLVMLTGDNSAEANKIANQLNITDFYGDLLPEDKVKIVNQLKENSTGVCFVGDGINDAPVLATSDCGFAMGLGSDAAIQSADAVLTGSNLSSLPGAVKIAKRTVNTAKTVIIFALAVKLAVILLAIFGIAAIWMSVLADTGVCMLCVLYATRILKTK